VTRRLKKSVQWSSLKEYRAINGDEAADAIIQDAKQRGGWKVAGRLQLTRFTDGSAEFLIPLRDGKSSCNRVLTFKPGECD
jgi:hypothetical protein